MRNFGCSRRVSQRIAIIVVAVGVVSLYSLRVEPLMGRAHIFLFSLVALPFVVAGAAAGINFIRAARSYKNGVLVYRIAGAVGIASFFPAACVFREYIAEQVTVSGFSANMEGLAAVCRIYAGEHGGDYPPDIATVLRDAKPQISPGAVVYRLSKTASPTEFFLKSSPSPSDDLYMSNHSDLIYLGRGLVLGKMGEPSTVPILCSKNLFWGEYCLVVFADDHVEIKPVEYVKCMPKRL